MGIYKFLFKGVAYASSRDLHEEWAKIETIGHMGHVREYTISELKHFMTKIGFEIESARSVPVCFGHDFRNRLMFGLEKLTGLGSNSELIMRRPG